MRRNGFDIKLRTRLGVQFYIEAEFYARPGQMINVVYNNVEVFPEPEALPVVMVWNEDEQNIHAQNENILYRELQQNERVIIQNDEIIVENIQGAPEQNDGEDENNE